MTDSVLPSHLIQPLCEPFSSEADRLLDLYELTQKPNRKPGQCLKCFYALFEKADDSKVGVLEPLKLWIEQNIEIAIKADDQVSGRFPIELEDPDFDSFCSHAIDRVVNDRVLTGELVELELRYKSSIAA